MVARALLLFLSAFAAAAAGARDPFSLARVKQGQTVELKPAGSEASFAAVRPSLQSLTLSMR